MNHAAAPTLFHRAGGFTLVEILIVVAILGILVALVVPRFSNAAQEARESTLRDDLRYLRTQIMVYRAQHRNVSPGYPGGDPSAAPNHDTFVAQMTQYSNESGATSRTPTSQFKFGPYLLKMPLNPIISSSEMRFVPAGAPFPATASGPEGWVYQPATGSIAANLPGKDTRGAAFFDY